MQLNGIAPTWQTYGAALNCCLKQCMLPQAQQYSKMMQYQGFHLNVCSLAFLFPSLQILLSSWHEYISNAIFSCRATYMQSSLEWRGKRVNFSTRCRLTSHSQLNTLNLAHENVSAWLFRAEMSAKRCVFAEAGMSEDVLRLKRRACSCSSWRRCRRSQSL